MTLLRLFWSFAKIGFTSFGGLSMIPLINEEMIQNGWMTAAEVSDIVAIAEMTPGPLGINCATFAGIRAAGLAGAAAANIGVLMPTLTLTLLAAAFFHKFKNSQGMKAVMSGVRPACIGMIFALCVSMSLTNYTSDGALYLPYVLLGGADLFLLLKAKMSVPAVIGINALAGVLLFGGLLPPV
ncbi:MAG: chromate transporter [Ruminococcaceae bacterium]|nr:chromate transporter [Oscillospiraceae bacterium]